MSGEKINVHEYQVLGYTNPIGVKPAPLVTILGNSKQEIFALFPEGNKIQRLAMKPGQKYNELKTFQKADDEQHINVTDPNQVHMYSYINHAGEIFTKKPEDMLEYIHADIDILQASGGNKEVIKALIDVYNQDAEQYGLELYNKE